MDQGDWTDPVRGRIAFGEYALAWLDSRANLKPKTRLCRARTRTLALSWRFLGSLRCPRVLADQAVDDLSALDPGGHIDPLARLVQRRSLPRD